MYVAAIFLPLLGAFIAGFFGRLIGNRGAQVVACASVALAALFGLAIFADVALGGHDMVIPLPTWFRSGDLEVTWALRFDSLSAVMILVVTVVSTMVHIYSVGYMAHDPSIPRFFAYLNLFTFFMLMLVTADNLVQLFFGWEGVGLCSYLLIGFWYDRPSANTAAMKAFIVNRVGDFGFTLGLFGVFIVFDSVDFTAIFAAAPGKGPATIEFLGFHLPAITTICFCLFMGAMGKSAQIGLHVWLPDAMEGPTPVSALIHAATMVTAGVFMVVRMSPLFELSDVALSWVTWIGASTALFAALVGCVQNDIKRVIAYSTCSQLGYMFFAAGVSAYPASMFHLTTHAFFKALLFLGAGSVIHAMSDEQDIRKMGGLARRIPVTTAMMVIGTLALTGFPFFAGYYSKDLIIDSAFAAHTLIGNYAFAVGVIAAFLTSFYSWRLIFLTFFGESRADKHVQDHIHESPLVMLLPLGVLAAGAIFAGMIGYESFVGPGSLQHFWHGAITILPGHDALRNAETVPLLVHVLPTLMMAAGLGLAALFYLYRPGLPAALAARFHLLYLGMLNKFYFDEIYDFLVVRTAKGFGVGFWKTGDGAIIDELGPDGLAATVLHLSRRASRLQSGYLYHYAFAMLAGVVALVTWYILHQPAAG